MTTQIQSKKKRRPSLRTVAKHVGLSATAVSLALRGDESIPLETRQRVAAAAAELDYNYTPRQPKRPAKALRRLVYVVNDYGDEPVTANPFYGYILQGAEQTSQAHHASLSYLVFYAVFGALNYTLVTEPYYASHAGGLVAPAAGTVLAVELVRAPLLVLSIVLLILAARTTRRRVLIIAGLTLFWVGGIVPLTLQIDSLPAPLLLASAAEIFLQNFLTGVVTAWLFWSARTATAPVSDDNTRLQPLPA